MTDLDGMGVRSRRTGREYEAVASRAPGRYVLVPLGWDVRPAQERGRFNGGARRKLIDTDRLTRILDGARDPSYERT